MTRQTFLLALPLVAGGVFMLAGLILWVVAR